MQAQEGDMSKKRPSRKEELKIDARRVGLLVRDSSPGGRQARYRFFEGTADDTIGYFGPGDGLATCFGIREAEVWLAGYVAGRTR